MSSVQWSPSPGQPILSTQEDRLNDSVVITATPSDPASETSWTWGRGDLPAQVTFTPNGNSLTVAAPDWNGLFAIKVVYLRNFVQSTATSWAAVPQDAMILDFEPSPVNRKLFTFEVHFSYRVDSLSPWVVESQTYTIEVFANYDVGKGQVQTRTVNKSGRPVSRKGDTCTGHGCFPPRASTSGSPDVFIGGVPMLRVSDSYATHTCGRNTHGGSQAEGAPFAFANGLSIARVGDGVSCGSAVAEGSDFVFSD